MAGGRYQRSNMNYDDNINTHRRALLTTTAGGLLFALAGCTGGSDESGSDEESNGSGDEESNGSGDESSGDSNGGNSDNDSSNESGSEGEDGGEEDPNEVENRAEGEDVLTFQELEIIEYEEEIVEEEYLDDQLVISGVVENHSEKKYDDVFVGVRAYNEEGHQLDQYLDTTSNLQAGGTWAFEVTVYDVPAEEVQSWDIGVWGYQW